jgi:hypothetical protein
MSRYKPTGWRNDSVRHSLAAKGFKTRRDAFAVSDFIKKARVEYGRPTGITETRYQARSQSIVPPKRDLSQLELTPEERKEATIRQIEFTLRPTELRAAIVGKVLTSLPPMKGEQYDDYQDRVMKEFREQGVDPSSRQVEVYVSEPLIRNGTVVRDALGKPRMQRELQMWPIDRYLRERVFPGKFGKLGDGNRRTTQPEKYYIWNGEKFEAP